MKTFHNQESILAEKETPPFTFILVQLIEIGVHACPFLPPHPISTLLPEELKTRVSY